MRLEAGGVGQGGRWTRQNLTLYPCRPGRWAGEWAQQPFQEVDAVHGGSDPQASEAAGPSQVSRV